MSSEIARLRVLSLFVCAVSMLSYLPAYAAVGYSVSAGASHSDNIRRSPDGLTIDDTVTNLTAAFIWSNQSPRLSMSFFGQGTYLQYVDGTYDDDLIPRATLSIDWDILPARLNWVVDNRYGQIASDPFSAFTPDSIEDTNIFSTGPDLTFGSSPRQLLILGIRAEDQWYEDQTIDNQRLNGRAEFIHRISEDQNVGFTLYAERVAYEENAENSDYDVFEAFATYSRSLSSFYFALDAGVTALDIQGQKSDGVLGRLNISKSTESGWTVRASGEYSYTDSGNRFLIGREQSTAGPGQSVDDDTLVAAAGPLRLEHYDGGFARQGERSDFDVNIYWESEDFELDPLFNREQSGITLSYALRMTPLNLLVFRGNFRKVKFDTALREDENTEFELRFQRTLTDNFALTARIGRLRRESTDLANQYEENVYGLIMTYNSDLMDSLQSRPRSNSVR